MRLLLYRRSSSIVPERKDGAIEDQKRRDKARINQTSLHYINGGVFVSNVFPLRAEP